MLELNHDSLLRNFKTNEGGAVDRLPGGIL